MTDTSKIPDPPESGLPDNIALDIYRALINRYFELTLQAIDRDISTAATMETGPSLKSLTARAKWWKKIDLMMEADRLFERRYGTPMGELRLVEEVFAEQLGIAPTLMPQDIEQRLDWYKRRLSADYGKAVRERIDRHGVRSPIEQIFLMEWHFLRIEERFGVTLTPQHEATVEGQTYRLDFSVTKDGATNKLGIELDGHAFHEKTALQVSKDKKRERALIREGFTILRFTGTEMVRTPRKCLEEVADVIASKIA